MNSQERTFDDLLNQAEVKDFLFRAEREMFPKLKDSALSLVLCASEPDAKLAIEVGAAVLFDKPIIVLVRTGTPVPPGLRRIAHSIVEIDDFHSDVAQQKITAALRPFMPEQHP